MNAGIRVDNQTTLSKFISDVDGFHDSLLHEAVLLHPGHVSEDGKMYRDTELPNAQLILQSQFSDVLAVRIELKQVSIFRLTLKREFKLEGEITDREIALGTCG